MTTAVGTGRNVMSTITVINAAYQAVPLYFSGKYVADSADAMDSETSRGFKVGCEIYYSASDDMRIRMGVVDVAGQMIDVTSEYQFVGESGYGAVWQYVTINRNGAIQLRAATGPNTARPTDSYFQWGEAGGSGFNHALNGYYYGPTERIIGTIWRVNATTWYVINMGSGCEESGSNANGRYIKYSDGTLICYGTDSASYAITNAAGSVWFSGSQTKTFAHAFVSAPQVSVRASNDGASSISWTGVGNQATTSTNFLFAYLSATSHTTTMTSDFIAIGQWKA